MAAKWGIEMRGFKELREKLRRMDADLQVDLERTTRAALESVVAPEVRRYAPQSGKKMKFKTAKQRRYVMWAIRTGKIKVPYQRTDKLRTSWGVEVKKLGGGTVGTLGSDLSYGPWVMSSKRIGSTGPQAGYHRGNWRTLQAVFKGKLPEIRNMFKLMVKRWLKK